MIYLQYIFPHKNHTVTLRLVLLGMWHLSSRQPWPHGPVLFTYSYFVDIQHICENISNIHYDYILIVFMIINSEKGTEQNGEKGTGKKQKCLNKS